MMWSGVIAFEGEEMAGGLLFEERGLSWGELPIMVTDAETADEVGLVVSLSRLGHAIVADIELPDAHPDSMLWALPVFQQEFSETNEVRGIIQSVLLYEDEVEGMLPLAPIVTGGDVQVVSHKPMAGRPTQEQIDKANEKMAQALFDAMNADADDRLWRDADAYQNQSCTTALLSDTDLWYFALGLSNEAGEVAGKVKKLYRDDDGVMSDERREQLKGELGDVAWYLAVLAAGCGLRLGDVFAANVRKLQDRKERGTLGGDGDKR